LASVSVSSLPVLIKSELKQGNQCLGNTFQFSGKHNSLKLILILAVGNHHPVQHSTERLLVSVHLILLANICHDTGPVFMFVTSIERIMFHAQLQ